MPPVFSTIHTVVAGFNIGVTDVRPSERSPVDLSESEYTVCANHPNRIAANTTERVVCKQCMRGRYLFVVSPGGPRNFILCEVEVYLDHCGLCLSYAVPFVMFGSSFFCLSIPPSFTLCCSFGSIRSRQFL